MDKQEFEEKYCKKSNITLSEYHENFITLSCSCGDPSCEGWACVCNDAKSIKAHKELYNL